MIYSDITALKLKINQLYSNKTPFFFIVNYEQTEGYCIEAPLNQREIFFKFPNADNKQFAKPSKRITFEVIPNNPEEYKSKFEKLQEFIASKEIVLANLTDKTEIKTNASIEDVFALSESRYQLFVPERFVCFSPERFVRIADGKIYTNPMKGTIDASIPYAEEIILNDKKEIAEHTAVVNFLSNELKTVAKNVKTSRFRYIDKVKNNRKTLLQVSSEIVGELLPDYENHFGDIVFNLLPAGSIGGTPKQRAFELLSKIEGVKRGYYCGIAGYFDGNEFDSAVLIRFIEQNTKNNKLYFRSGGGITIDSVWEKEYQEVLNKIYLPFCLKEPVFVETLKIENNKIYNFKLHQERMQKTAFHYYGTKPKLHIDFSTIPSDLKQKTIKCRVLYSSGVKAIEYHAYKFKKINSLRVVNGNDIEYSYKSIDRYCLNSLFEQRAGADDIIIAKNEKITDSSFANLVFETFDGEMFTPKTFLLEGTKRKSLINSGVIKEKDITIADMPKFRKVYLINAMIDIDDDISVSTESIIFS